HGQWLRGMRHDANVRREGAGVRRSGPALGERTDVRRGGMRRLRQGAGVGTPRAEVGAPCGYAYTRRRWRSR
ncbi:hypothetical protein NGM37_15685, partial [Streptomyces sp. TRM76130]|nr:hypothetical protein [Streptomyces sp. TRM76130]